MSKKELGKWVGIGCALLFVGYIFFSDALLRAFNLNMDNQESSTVGVRAVDTKVGAGLEAEAGDSITAHYTGRLSNGNVFDSSVSRGEPITFTLGIGQVIRGWDEGLLGMKEGGKRQLTISPDYGYGSRQVGPIPANSTLIFEVELIKVDKR